MLQTDSIPRVLSRVDTLYIERVDPLYHETYIKLLEKSNDQLSLIGNPFAWVISLLGVLFAIGAIVSGVHFWALSTGFNKEKKKLLNELEQFKIEYEENLKGMFDAHVIQLNSINKVTKNLNEEGFISREDLDAIQESIHKSTTAINSVSKDFPFRNTYHRPAVHKCFYCDQDFAVVYEFDKTPDGSVKLFNRVCPHCSKTNSIPVHNSLPNLS
jgi:hypothetical protein